MKSIYFDKHISKVSLVKLNTYDNITTSRSKSLTNKEVVAQFEIEL